MPIACSTNWATSESPPPFGGQEGGSSPHIGNGQDGASLFVSRHSDSRRITALAFNYPQEFEQKVPSSANAKTFMQATAKTIDCTLTGLQPGTQFTIETLDYQHGNAYNEWLP